MFALRHCFTPREAVRVRGVRVREGMRISYALSVHGVMAP